MYCEIDAVFVTYKPDLKILKNSLASIKDQIRDIYIVDNSDDVDARSGVVSVVEEFANIHLIQLGENVGIAKAQNIGIMKVLDMGAYLTLLSDQDTIYPENFAKEMIANYGSILDKTKVAAIAPNFKEINKGGDAEGFFILDGVTSVKSKSESIREEVSQVIASGMLIVNSIVLDIGLMDEDLFIDWVDFEWCWRAKSKGYRIIGCRNVVINHTLGDSAGAIGGRVYCLHSPRRNYYIVRNGISIALTKKYLANRVRVGIFLKSLRYVIGFTILSKQHTKNFVYCAVGLYHGLIGQLGSFEKSNTINVKKTGK